MQAAASAEVTLKATASCHRGFFPHGNPGTLSAFSCLHYVCEQSNVAARSYPRRRIRSRKEAWRARGVGGLRQPGHLVPVCGRSQQTGSRRQDLDDRDAADRHAPHPESAMKATRDRLPFRRYSNTLRSPSYAAVPTASPGLGHRGAAGEVLLRDRRERGSARRSTKTKSWGDRPGRARRDDVCQLDVPVTVRVPLRPAFSKQPRRAPPAALTAALGHVIPSRGRGTLDAFGHGSTTRRTNPARAGSTK